MNNRQVARTFNMLSKLMELHGENPFKTRSYSSAYNTIRRYPDPIVEMSKEDLVQIKGIGNNIADKIIELGTTGSIAAMQQYIEITPPGVVELLGIKGLGAKKLLTIWKDLEVETPGELLYACEENRLLELKGFGEKTQKNLADGLRYYLDGKGKYLYGHVIKEAEELLHLLQGEFDDLRIEMVGDIARKMPEVNGLEYLVNGDTPDIIDFLQELEDVEIIDDHLYFQGSKVIVTEVGEDQYNQELWHRNASQDYINAWQSRYGQVSLDQSDADIFSEVGLGFIPIEARESEDIFEAAAKGPLSIIETQDIKGVIHTHTVYSDGINTIAEMAQACIDKGYEYLVISDHSQSAFYANGLKPDRVLEQMEEIDQLNQSFSDFKIYKSIESDILIDGSLDYEDSFLDNFDLVIGSVHSVLKMSEEKATERLLRAIEHPATNILGHMTGRLLLSRPGYPIDHQAIIEACAAHQVVIELNANPYRLDMDWQWINFATERGVKIAINPDAHSIEGIDDIKYGVAAARKAGMKAEHCLNCFGRAEFEHWIQG